MFSSKITTTCLMGVLVFAFFGWTKATVGALEPVSAAAEVATVADDVRGAASEPGTVAVRTRAASAPAEAHRPKVVPRRRGMS